MGGDRLRTGDGQGSSPHCWCFATGRARVVVNEPPEILELDTLAMAKIHDRLKEI
jgi:hypothetical protein